MKRFDTVLNIFGEERREMLDSEIQSLIDERQEARRRRDFARGDEIRDELAARELFWKTPKTACAGSESRTDIPVCLSCVANLSKIQSANSNGGAGASPPSLPESMPTVSGDSLACSQVRKEGLPPLFRSPTSTLSIHSAAVAAGHDGGRVVPHHACAAHLLSLAAQQ